MRATMNRVTRYVCGVAVSAVSATAALLYYGGAATARGTSIVLFLCAIGWVARRLTLEGSTEGASGRIYFFVFPAAAIAVADWTVPVGVAVTMFGIERARRADAQRLAFNTAAPALASALSIFAYRLAGGVPWSIDSTALIIPPLVLLVAGRLVNDLSLAGVLSLSQAKSLRQTWRAVAGRTLLDDIMVAPVVGFLAYTVVRWGFVAATVISATLFWVHKLYQTHHALIRLSSELLELMVTAIEARDKYTSGHSRRVSLLAMEIARCLGLPDREVQRHGVAGLLHDVGKIHEKYASILRKSDRLTKDEWLLMKEHPADGEALVAKVSELRDILPAVRHHHERWDGGGYPDGLRGEAIPMMARVLALADTIDAMTSTRPYRRGLTQDEVRAEIAKCSGLQFDPRIASAVLASDSWNTLLPPFNTDTPQYGLKLVADSARAAHRRIAAPSAV
jgi:HD-GYP domain-containing protein (c-di-GMP phosphodiesterase class II)